MRWMAALLLLTVATLAASCDGEPEDGPYVEYAGGGFVFNYRIAEATYGFVVKRIRGIPPGTVLEAQFENPAGGDPLIERQTARQGALQYRFQSPPVSGVKADRDYRIELRLLDPASGALIASYVYAIRSQLDQSVLPDQPLTVGPGYQPNPQDAQGDPGKAD